VVINLRWEPSTSLPALSWHPFQIAFILLSLSSLTTSIIPTVARRRKRCRRPAVVPDRWRRKKPKRTSASAYTLAIRQLQGEIEEQVQRAQRGRYGALRSPSPDAAAISAGKR